MVIVPCYAEIPHILELHDSSEDAKDCMCQQLDMMCLVKLLVEEERSMERATQQFAQDHHHRRRRRHQH
jgi:hypothetical protein